MYVSSFNFQGFDHNAEIDYTDYNCCIWGNIAAPHVGIEKWIYLL